MSNNSNDTGKGPGMFGRLFGRSGDATADDGSARTEAEAAAQVATDGEAPDGQGNSPADTAAETTSEPAKQGWFKRLTSGLAKTSSRLTEGITSVFTKSKLEASDLDDLEDILIQADLGVDTAMRITERISSGRYDKGISPDQVREILAGEVESVLAPVARELEVGSNGKPHVILMVGVNGTGKTTTIGKLAAQFRDQNKSVLLVAGDTFRAAAIEQLQVWGERTGCRVLARDVGSDAAGLAFDAIELAQAESYDVVLMDTAGRLQNKAELMDELEKIVRVMRKVDPDAPHDVLLVLDATTGQNAISQVEVFRERAGVSGLVMTKLDGTARGGILVAIASKYGLPIHAIGVGEGIEDLASFDAKDFAQAIALG
ncbi:MAG: signal recognition particle-docking protein FtsY [Hyphomicrobiaceae bacterium]